MSNDHLGQKAWDAYRTAVGHLSFQGNPLPDWANLGERQRIGWRAAAEAIREVCTPQLQPLGELMQEEQEAREGVL